MLVVLLLSVLRVLCLSLMVALIYSGAVLITFIFVVMTFDQSDILCIPSYKFIPLLVLYIEATSVNGNNAAEGIQRYNLETSIV